MFKFTMLDSFGTSLSSRLKETRGLYSASVVIDNIHWLDVDSWPTLGAMDCSVYRVLFRDGSSWKS